MYDENDGFFDHMPSDLAPLNPSMGKTTLADIGAHETYQGEPVGLGPRVPMLVISPWSRGGKVCSQLFDHTSQLRFLEEWLVHGLGKPRAAATCDLISPWRRAVCGDLTSALDFNAPNREWPAGVPSTAAYARVSGKPYPQPPTTQTLPRQEPQAASGPRIACALPYALAVTGRLTAAHQFALSFTNSGQAGAAFIVYSSLRNDGPWYYTIDAGRRIEHEAWRWSGDAYALSVHGPNGFLREFNGRLAATGTMPELDTRDERSSGNLILMLCNREGRAACRFTVTDNAYGAVATSYSVAAGQIETVSRDLSASFGWYDVSITSDADPQWLRRAAGHVETGRASRTDPVIGAFRAR